MSDSSVTSAVTRLVDDLATAAPDQLDTAFHHLVNSVWHDGRVTPAATTGAGVLVGALDRVPSARRGHLALLLGLLVETEHPHSDGELTRVVRSGLDTWLARLADLDRDDPVTTALLYLVAHFPTDRDRVLAATRHLALTPPDQTRLERSLAQLDPADPDLGRAWPSPAEWAISDEEREFDRQWIRGLSPEQVTKTWNGDTRSVLATMGAKAFWALRHGTPVEVTDSSPYRDAVETDPRDLGPAAFARHAEVLWCPTCRGHLTFAGTVATCTDCGTGYPTRYGVLDLSQRIRAGAGVSDDTDAVEADVLQNAAVLRGIGFHYELGMRPNFLRVMGMNWSGAVTPAVEDDYIARHARHDGGTVLDLAAGAGRWTAVLARTVGAERVLALDLNEAMLYDLRSRLPEVPAVRASALDLPFADASLDAVNCWNALQALPDAAKALSEVGRCLKPGGTLTLMTFRWADSPVYRYFQASHHFPARPDGFLLFELDEIRSWLDAAGLVVREESRPGTFVFVTAERRP